MDNNKYYDRISDYINDLCIDNSVDYSEELQNYINIHNTSIAEFCQSILSSSLLSILIKKGIITDEEFISEFDTLFNSSKQKEMIEKNRDQIIQCIEAESDFNTKLEDMYDDLESRYNDDDSEIDDHEYTIAELLNGIPFDPDDDE